MATNQTVPQPAQVSLRELIISAARKQDPDIGDEAMIVSGEWHYCVAATIFVSKKSIRALQFPAKA